MIKKLCFVLIIIVIMLSGCGNQTDSDGENNAGSSTESENSFVNPDNDVVEIKERFFLTHVNDVYLNPDDYEGKSIKLEGIYHEFPDEETNYVYKYVFRYGPGCCGMDDIAGFLIIYDEDAPQPENDDWVEAIGTVDRYVENNHEYIRLKLSELTILDERGAETVTH